MTFFSSLFFFSFVFFIDSFGLVKQLAQNNNLIVSLLMLLKESILFYFLESLLAVQLFSVNAVLRYMR